MDASLLNQDYSTRPGLWLANTISALGRLERLLGSVSTSLSMLRVWHMLSGWQFPIRTLNSGVFRVRLFGEYLEQRTALG